MRILILAATLLFFGGARLGAQEPTTEKATDKATVSRGGTDTYDPNIRHKGDTNAPDADIPAPPSKGGTSRDGACEIHIDNRTSLYVKIYIDGDNQGTIGPYGDAITYPMAGSRKLYAKAEYTTGNANLFGPRLIDCQRSFTWTLTK